MGLASYSVDYGTRLDVEARGSMGRMERIFLDISVFLLLGSNHMPALLFINVSVAMGKTSDFHRHSTIVPFVMSCIVGRGTATSVTLRRLAGLLDCLLKNSMCLIQGSLGSTSTAFLSWMKMSAKIFACLHMLIFICRASFYIPPVEGCCLANTSALFIA